VKLYKLTDKNDQTYGDCQWGEGVTHTADGKGRLCTKHWIHAYTDPILAVLMNPIHGEYDTYTGHMWECEGEIGRNDRGLKVGCKKLTTIKRIDMPRITIEQTVRFAILCAKKVCKDRTWTKWANDWLNGENRNSRVACIAACSIYNGGAVAEAASHASDAAGAVAEAASHASDAAGAVAEAASHASDAAYVADLVYAAYAGDAADDTAIAASYASNIADINLVEIAYKAVKGD